jgi:hypothetical protein
MRLRHRWSRIEHQEREDAFHLAAFFSFSALMNDSLRNREVA